ncbi:hypothetical protein MKEN_00291700 [Mycena kentingensis (nom. inval.)]|nr:hypothetical protein MKEN_00291700 [Mycena kentingensis (nom. inval.)]
MSSSLPSSSRPPKRVRWALDLESFAGLDSPEARTRTASFVAPSPGALPPLHPTINTTTSGIYEQLPSPHTPPSRTPFSLPPTPHPNANVPLPSGPTPAMPASEALPSLQPQEIVLHHALTPAGALPLDLSFPSASFNANPVLTQELLSAPACTPPRKSLTVRIETPPNVPVPHKVRLGVDGRQGDFVTVGNVLARIQQEFRMSDGPLPSAAAAATAAISASPPGALARSTPSPSSPSFTFTTTAEGVLGHYAHRRISSVNGYIPPGTLPLAAQHESIAREQAGGMRVADRFLGHVLFAGLTHIDGLGEAAENFQLELAVPQRYMLAAAPPSPPSPTTGRLRREI